MDFEEFRIYYLKNFGKKYEYLLQFLWIETFHLKKDQGRYQ